MKIRDYLYTLAILICGTAISSAGLLINPYRFAAPGGGGPSYLINQNFEGTGYDNGETWTSFAGGGTIDPDYTTSPIVGSQSLRIVVTGANQAASYTQFTGTDTPYIYCRFRLDSNTGEAKLFVIDDNAYGSAAVVTVTAGGKLAVLASGAGSPNESTNNLPTATDLHFWIDVIKGTGANHTVKAGWNTIATKPSLTAGGATSAVSAAGTGTAQPARLFCGTYSSETMAAVYDAVQISTIPIP
jgi:hypothetical protein